MWRVLDHRGFTGLSLRAVATELGATTGVVTHYFHSKSELTSYALDLLAHRTEDRPRKPSTSAVDAVRSGLLDMLPLDADSRTTTRIWVGSWDAALADDTTARAHAARYRASRAKLAALVEQALVAQGVSAAHADALAERLHAFVLGLATQAVLDPEAYPREHQTALLDEELRCALQPRGHGVDEHGGPTTR